MLITVSDTLHKNKILDGAVRPDQNFEGRCYTC